MTTAQRAELERLLRELVPSELHHGGAVGADRESHEIALRLGIPSVVVHPSNDVARTADLGVAPTTTVVTYLEARDPLKRNKTIVRAADTLIAAPASATEQVRSGTWFTIRFARRSSDVEIIVLSPDGGVL